MIWRNGHWHNNSLQKNLENGAKKWIYEVIRVHDACPVFISEHLDRLWQGATNIKVPLLHKQRVLFDGLFELIEKEKLSIGNIRIQVDQQSGLTLIGFIPHRYPSSDDYDNGISVALLNAERGIPNVKSWNPLIRRSADEQMRQSGSYETILVNQQGFLTEGSRSNFFGIKNGQVITPPVKQVLPGITRQVLLRLAQENGILLTEAYIHKTEIDQFESFFITGTSPGVLSIREIDDHAFPLENLIVQNLSALYQEAIKEDIDQTCSTNQIIQ